MTMEYHASTGSNLEIEESKIGYNRLFGDGSSSSLHNLAFAWRNRPYRVATVCLGLLCVLLLAGVIGQSIHSQKVAQVHQDNVKAVVNEKENLQDSLKSVQKDKRTLEAKVNQAEQKNKDLSKVMDQIQANYKLLTNDLAKAKLGESQLREKNDDLTKGIQQLRANKSRSDTNYNVLAAAKDLLQKQYDRVVKRKDELESSQGVLTRERDNFHNKFNNVTRAKEKLLMSYNDLVKDIEHLQDRYSTSTSEKDKLENSHQNLTAKMDTLQENFNSLKKAADILRANYASLVQEKKELESNFNNVTAERELLRVKVGNLTGERDGLQGLVDQLNQTMQDKKCSTGWVKFENSCYYISTGKKNWKSSRDYCQSKGAYLAIIKSKKEMDFVNGLFGDDKEVWIGLSDDGVEGEWKWVDGSPMTQSFWGPGQPNSFKGKEQDCVEFWHRSSGAGEWNDETCTLEQYWLCEM